MSLLSRGFRATPPRYGRNGESAVVAYGRKAVVDRTGAPLDETPCSPV